MMSLDMSFKKVLAVIFLGLALWASYSFSRPLPMFVPVANISMAKTSPAVSLPWPAYGQGALGAKGYGVLITHGEQKPVPIASITKVVTALAVLKEKPLTKGEKGPNITINSDDVAIYNEYAAQGGSVTPITKGSQISEYDALQSMLIPSSNNMAATVAKWAFGSVDNYVKYANQMLAEAGFKQTRVDEASGFSVKSVSTATELIKLGEAALANEVIAEIVKKTIVKLPIAGEVRNINWLLGTEEGVIGIKTGNTEEAGGCLLFAAKKTIFGQPITLIGVILGAPDRNQAISDSRDILRSAVEGFEKLTIVKKGQVLGAAEAPWSAKSEFAASDELTVIAWRGASIKPAFKAEGISAPKLAGSQVGEISVSYGEQKRSVPVELKSDLAGPGWRWRLFR